MCRCGGTNRLICYLFGMLSHLNDDILFADIGSLGGWKNAGHCGKRIAGWMGCLDYAMYPIVHSLSQQAGSCGKFHASSRFHAVFEERCKRKVPLSTAGCCCMSAVFFWCCLLLFNLIRNSSLKLIFLACLRFHCLYSLLFAIFDAFRSSSSRDCGNSL